MRNRLIGLLLILAAMAYLPGSVEAAVLKLATVAPEGSQWMVRMRQGAQEIKERTEGRVQIKFFGGGVMGNEKSVLRKIRIGQLHGGAFTGGGLVAIYPDLSLYSLPLLFKDLEELDFVREHMDGTLQQGLEQAGFVSFGFGEGGFAKLMSNVPVKTLEDLKGQKVWIPEGDHISYEVMEHLGLSPVTLPITDVMTGLQTGLIDIVGTSPIGAIAFQWHTRVKYVADTPLAYLFGTLVVDRRAFGRLKEGDRKIVRGVMETIYKEFNRLNRQDNLQAAKALSDQGLVYTNSPPEEVARLRSKAMSVIRILGEKGSFDPALLQRLQGLQQQYRNGQGTGAAL